MISLISTVDRMADDLVLLRRDIHRTPELAWAESRTTAVVAERLERSGIAVTRLPVTGCYADLGPPDAPFRIGLRADLDALPLQERTGLPWASRIPGVSHACGHDVHTAALVGAGQTLHVNRHVLEELGLGVRLIFQPAEEVQPSGAPTLVGTPALDGLDRMFALHCDPSRDVGTLGLKAGPITAAADRLVVELTGAGGHTSRPHLTTDLTYALAKVVTEVPAALSRRVDPRSGVVLVWGMLKAGTVANVIPDTAQAQGTVRMLDDTAWGTIEPLVTDLVEAIVAPYGAHAEVRYTRGMPPVVNTESGIEAFRAAGRAVLGRASIGQTVQSLGGEDFSWLLRDRDGALARLGTRTPGGPTYDLHQGDLVVDERATPAGAKLLAAVAVTARRQAREIEPRSSATELADVDEVLGVDLRSLPS